MTTLALLAAACVSVSGPHITAGDLAKAIPAFASADPATLVAYSPVPGVRRTIRTVELLQLQSRLRVAGDAPGSDVCFERETTPLSAATVLQAMRDALSAEARIEVLEISSFPAPRGQVIFPRRNLGSASIALWRGYVLYDGDKKFFVWARVKVRVPTLRLIAQEDLMPGKRISPSQVRMQTVEDVIDARSTPSTAADVKGAIARRIIPKGSAVLTEAIEPPKDVLKGDRVAIAVRSGAAELSFEASAETSGNRGDSISLKNPDSGKIFRARVDGPGSASIETGSFEKAAVKK